VRRPAPSAVRAVTLDCWGTLLIDGPVSDDERYRRRRLSAMQAILVAAGISVASRELEQAYGESGRRLGRIWQSQRDVPVSQHVEFLIEALDAQLPARLSAATMDALVRAYADAALGIPPTADDGARAALDELAAGGVALGVVSNIMRTPGTVLRGIFERAGLLAPFEVLTFSDECGIRKPDPEIFLLTLRKLGVPPEEAVHVGDDPILDVEGARDAGMGVIQLAPHGRATAPVKPDAVITRLRELPAALARLGA
jgi:putative hydrolase of the HAD superfamily